MSSNLTAFAFIAEGSEATPGLFNRALSQLSDNIQAAYVGTGLSLQSNATSGFLYAQQGVAIGSYPPSQATTAGLQIGVNSNQSDYLYLTDSSNQRSNYVIGSRVGNTADGLNIWDASGSTMIASFSKQSIRFWQNVVGPVFDVGGSLTNTLNAATFGTAADSLESRIQAAILAAKASGISFCYLPSSMLSYSASSISFIHTVRMVREGGVDWQSWDVIAYGAKHRSLGSSTSAFQAVFSGVSESLGGRVWIPAGRYSMSTTIDVGKNVLVDGAGEQAAIVDIDHNGHGFRSFWPTNGSTGVRSTFRNFALYHGLGTNSAAGFYDHGGTYLLLERLYIEGFKHQIAFDQTEIATIKNCETQQSSSNCSSGIWLVNGPDLVVGTNPGFTNGITIQDHQFNAGVGIGINLRDDGGQNHTLINCNFNGGAYAAEFVNVNALSILNGASEGHTVRGLSFTTTQALSGRTAEACQGVTIQGIAINDDVDYSITILAGSQGVIEGCWFSAANVAAIRPSGSQTYGWRIGNNRKRIDGFGSEVSGPFIDATVAELSQHYITQLGMSRVSVGHSGSVQTVVPVHIGAFPSSEFPAVGSTMYCLNADGTNSESVVVTNSTSTTWCATFASAKTNGWQSYKVSGSVNSLTAPTLQNSWVNFDVNANANAGHWVDASGTVHLQGDIAGGTTTAGTVLFTLPTDRRPKRIHKFPVMVNNTIGRVDVTLAGDVIVQVAASNTFLSLDGIAFVPGE